MNLSAEPECNASPTTAVELTCYAQTLLGERIVIPTCVRAAAPAHAVIEREDWERLQRQREQILLERLLVQMKRKAGQRRPASGYSLRPADWLSVWEAC